MVSTYNSNINKHYVELCKELITVEVVVVTVVVLI